jgi:hypothetical protein
MNSYSEVYEQWFKSEDNVIVIHEYETEKLIFGIEDGSIAIAYVMQIGDDYEISIDKRINVGKYSYKKEKLILDTEKELYKILLNLMIVIKRRGVLLTIGDKVLEGNIEHIEAKCDMLYMKNLLNRIAKYCVY